MLTTPDHQLHPPPFPNPPHASLWGVQSLPTGH